MNPQKRIRPLMSISEVFRIPQILLAPAMLVSCAWVPMGLLVEPISINTVTGAAVAALIFTALVLFLLVIPGLNALVLRQNGIDGTAAIIKREKRPRYLITATYRTYTNASYVTFEFTPQGASAPIRLEAEVGKIYSKLAEGKSARIRYAASNPRIVKFNGE